MKTVQVCAVTELGGVGKQIPTGRCSIYLFMQNAFKNLWAGRSPNAKEQEYQEVRQEVIAPSNPISTTLGVSEPSIWLYLVMEFNGLWFSIYP